MELYLKTDCGCLMAAFSPDGSLLALALTDGRIQVKCLKVYRKTKKKGKGYES